MRPFRPLYLICDAIRHRLRQRRWLPAAALGRRGEDLAHRYLENKGMTVVERNWTRGGVKGEVDLVAWEGEQLVLVEVKARSSDEHGAPDRAIDETKLRCLRNAAYYFSRRWNVPEDHTRLDLVSIVVEPYRIEHLPDAWPLRAPR